MGRDEPLSAEGTTGRIALTLNHAPVVLLAAPGARLLDVLRREGHCTGVKEGCGEGECGACSVLIDGEVACSCIVLAQSVEGQSLLTIEGLGAGGQHPLQSAFVRHMGTQCGFCTPGFVLAALELLARNPTPTREDILDAISGNLCRCTGYTRIVRAIEDAAREMRERVDANTESLPAQSVACALAEEPG